MKKIILRNLISLLIGMGLSWFLMRGSYEKTTTQLTKELKQTKVLLTKANTKEKNKSTFVTEIFDKKTGKLEQRQIYNTVKERSFTLSDKKIFETEFKLEEKKEKIKKYPVNTLSLGIMASPSSDKLNYIMTFQRRLGHFSIGTFGTCCEFKSVGLTIGVNF